MSIKMNADGSFEFSTPEEALAFYTAAQKQASQKKVNEQRSASLAEAAQKVEGSPLNKLQYRTWEFLVENDAPDGVHISQVAKAFGTARSAANNRLITLEKMGYAKRVAKGYYRAIDGD